MSNYRYNPEASRPVRTRANAKLRDQVFVLLGGVCVRCGFDDPRALQIDHVNGGGSEELRTRWRSTGALRRWIRDQGADGYQLLCANCNWIKRVEK